MSMFCLSKCCARTPTFICWKTQKDNEEGATHETHEIECENARGSDNSDKEEVDVETSDDDYCELKV